MKTTLDGCVSLLGSGLHRFPFEDAERYADWLAQTYYYVCHSTRLLAAAAARFPFDEPGNQLHVRFAAHMAEEKRHELLALHDLNALGRALEKYPERDSTRAFYEPQYYKIEHQAPITLFGYILALEGMSAVHGRSAFSRAQEAHSAAAATFLKVHAADDEDHLAKALAMLARIDEGSQRLVEINLRQSASGYLRMLDEMAAG